MTLPNELHPGFFTAAGGGGFTLDQSLRFRSGEVAYLSRTPGSGGSRTTWTYSFWYKPGSKTLASGNTGAGTVTFLSVNNTETNTTYAEFLSESDRLTFQGATVTWVMPDARIRDNSAWYHMVLICDTTNGTSTDRVRFYLNGERQTVFVQSSMPGSGDQLGINQTVEHTIGKRAGTNSNPLDGLLAEVNFIDGTAIADTSGILNEFGEYNEYGIWVPKAYEGSYGTQGYHLTFDSSGKAGQSGAGAAVGADQSSNNNHWTANNFDTSSIVSYNDDVYGDTSTTYDSTNTNKVFLGAAYGPHAMFDGDLANNACKSGTGQAQTWLYWRPSGGLSISSSLVVHCSNTADVRINGTSTGQTNDGTLSNFPITIANPPSTLTELAIQGNSISSATIYGVVVDGTTFLNNTDTDVDYFDTPTSNYATLNPIHTKVNSTTSISNGNLRISATATNAYIDAQSTIPASGVNCYCEATVIAQDLNGIGVGDKDAAIASGAGSYVTYRENGAVIKYPGNTTLATVATYDTGDVLGMTITSTQVAFYKNGTLQGTYNHTLTGDFYAIGMAYNSGATSTMDFNFGQFPFIYTIPSGFKKLQTNTLTAEPTIKEGNKHFGVLTYAAPGSPSYPVTINGIGGGLAGSGELDFEQSPDLVWIKMRNGGQNHILFDTVRGKTNSLRADEGISESTNRSNFDFATNGFTFSGADAESYQQNDTYCAWCWKAGGTPSITYTVKVVSDSGNKYRFNDFGASAVTLDLEEGGTYVFDQSDSSNAGHPLRFSTTSNGSHGGGSEYTTGVVTEGTPGQAGAKTTITVAASAPTLYYYCSVHSGMGGQANTNTTKGSSNFDGTIQTKVTANTDAGFSIVSYTGTNNNKTVGHGLNSALEFLIVKNRNDNDNWIVYHKDINPAGSPEDWYLQLDVEDARTLAGDAWGSTAPGSSVYNVGPFNGTNGSGDGLIAYCFHSVEGYSKFGYYTGAAGGSSPNANGPYVYLGFKPAYVLIKRSDNNYGGEWSIHDTQRDPINSNRLVLAADIPNTEATQGGIDFLSNGFKIRDAAGWTNQTGGTYVYAAFAESPFGGKNTTPATGR